MVCIRQFLNFLLNNNVTLLILYTLLRYYYSDLISSAEWTQLQISTADPKWGTGFPSIREVDGKWVVACGVRYNELLAPY